MTVLDVIQRSTEYLGKRGVDSPRLQTELLVAHLLKMPRMQLYLNFDRPLTDPELQTLRGLIRRRSQREPLQYIIGSTNFCGLEIVVNQHALIPRPETELLAAQGWQFLNQLSAARGCRSVLQASSQPGGTGEQSAAALDFGTGSGCLAIALAAHCAGATVCATDISAQALELARQNATRHGLDARIVFFQGDGFNALPARTRFHLIVSNPPYIPTAEIETLQPEVKNHDPRKALDGGQDGLNFYRRLATEAEPFLADKGKMMLEFGDGQAESICALFEKQNWVVEQVVADYTQRPRILIVRRAGRTVMAP